MQSTLILSRQTGTILRTSGLSSASETANPETASLNSPVMLERDEELDNKEKLRNAEDVARLVWKFFNAAGETVDELMGVEDEVKLLRLRTRRNELVIVPGESVSRLAH